MKIIRALFCIIVLLWMGNSSVRQVYSQSDIPMLVLDVEPGASSSCPLHLVAYRGNLVFNTGCEAGSRLWISNGTRWGTRRIQIEKPGQEFVQMTQPAVVVQDILYFNGYIREQGTELWRTDGTDQGTYMAMDLFPDLPILSVDPFFLTNFQGHLYFYGRMETPDNHTTYNLLRSDGTVTGTISLGQYTPNVSPPFILNNTLFFDAVDHLDQRGYELFKSDGTRQGTTLVRDILGGISGSSPSEFAEFQGDLYFSAATTESGMELWRSDGTQAGTVLVGGLPGQAGTAPRDLAVVDEYLLFSGMAINRGRELWRSDGTASGTLLLKDIYTGTEASEPTQLFPFAAKVVFSANDGHYGTELWQSDGTITGTTLLKDIRPGVASAQPADFFMFDESLYFVADDGQHGRELWRSDGTTTGTSLVIDIFPGRNSSLLGAFTVVDNQLFFVAEEPEHGRELWMIGPPPPSYTVYLPTILSSHTD